MHGAAQPPAAALIWAREGRLLTRWPERAIPGATAISPAGIAGTVLGGLVFGVVWGIVFRLFMRLISDDPEFTVAGTAFILAYATLVWGLSGVQLAARERGWPWWCRLVPSVLVVGLLAFMTIFGPTMPLIVVPLWLALSRGGWPVQVRLVLFGVGALAYAASWAVIIYFDPAFHPLSALHVFQGVTAVVAGTAVLVPVLFALAWAVEPVHRSAVPVGASIRDTRGAVAAA
jgi:hypothetical protein